MPNTRSFPARAIVLVTFAAGRCSGALIGADTVLTAGHCVHDGPGGNWQPVDSFRIYPGKDGNLSPYGSCSAKRLYSVSGWTNLGRNNFDYGAIKLDCTIGSRTGFLGFSSAPRTIVGSQATTSGYPGDKPLSQWTSTGPITQWQPSRLFYEMDTTPGQSGSAVFDQRAGCGACVIAVHAYGSQGAGDNFGPRISGSVFKNLQSWKNAN